EARHQARFADPPVRLPRRDAGEVEQGDLQTELDVELRHPRNSFSSATARTGRSAAKGVPWMTKLDVELRHPRNSFSSAATRSGRSSGTKWPASGIVTSFARGMSRAIPSARVRGSAGSFSPQITRVGASIERCGPPGRARPGDRKSTRLNSSH